MHSRVEAPIVFKQNEILGWDGRTQADKGKPRFGVNEVLGTMKARFLSLATLAM